VQGEAAVDIQEQGCCQAAVLGTTQTWLLHSWRPVVLGHGFLFLASPL